MVLYMIPSKSYFFKKVKPGGHQEMSSISLFMSPNKVGGVVGSQSMSTAVHMGPEKTLCI